jgi:cell division septation protein DedD
MRNFFLILVLLNLAFAAWAAWFAPSQRIGRSADEGLPSITLVSEVPADLRSAGVVSDAVELEVPSPDPPETEGVAETPPDAEVSDEALADTDVDAPAPEPAPAPAVSDAAAGGGAATVATRCTSVGPFRELSQAATAAAALRTSGYQPLQRVAEGEIWIGYWVYIPAIPTEAEANTILARMRAEGITDSYVIPNSDSGNLVSLGVFSEISGVGRRRDQIRALGFEPQVVDRTRRATVYWIDITLAEGQALDFDALQPPGRIIRLEQRDCEKAD